MIKVVMAESVHPAIKNVILIRITSRHKKHACSRSFFSCCFYRTVLKDQNKKSEKKEATKVKTLNKIKPNVCDIFRKEVFDGIPSNQLTDLYLKERELSMSNK